MVLTLLILTLGGIEVVGPVECPNSAAVRRKLDQLLSESQAKVHHLVLVDGVKSNLYAWVFDGPSATLLVKRAVPAAGSCEVRALSLATVVATWEAEFQELQQQPLTERPPPPAPLPEALPPAAPPPPDRKPVIAPLLGAPPPSFAVAPPSPPLPMPWLFSAGLAGGLAVSDGVAPSAAVVLSTRPWMNGPGLSVTLLVPGPVTRPFGGGHVRWFAPELGFGLHYHLERGRLWGELEAQAVVAVFFSQGSGFVDNQSVGNWQVGPGLAARAGLRFDPWQPWLGVWSAWWPGAESLLIPETGAAFGLPHGTVSVGVGLSLSSEGRP